MAVGGDGMAEGTDRTPGRPETDEFAQPLSELPPRLKALRAESFGQVAAHYERYRPGPPVAALDWILPTRVGRVVDLGAGTGALTRLLAAKADEVVAVEPDDQMRAMLTREVPGAEALKGRGESIPLPDHSVDAVLASSSWHWMDPVPTLHEVGRILVAGGTLAALWSGPDPDGPFMVQARELLVTRSGPPREDGPDAERADPDSNEFAAMILGDAGRPASSLEIPPGLGFDPPDRKAFHWEVALDADDLIGLLGTLSWIITMPEESRGRVLAEARRLLRELLGLVDDRTVDVSFRSDVWRSRRRD